MRHLLASAAVAVLMAGASPVLAETPEDQLIVAFNMNNVLTMDPAAITGGEAVQILNNVYDALVQLNPETRVLEPRLAESWEISDDNMTVTFTLRDDAVFASGNPVTAHDVEYSLKRLLTLPQQLQARQQGNIWWGSGGREQPHAGASTEELRDGLVAVALDKVLLLHVGMEFAKH